RKLFKLILFCSVGFYVPLAILMGLLAVFEIVPVTMNNQQYIGFKGLIISILFTPVFIMILTLSHWVFLAIGLKLAKVGYFLFYKIKRNNTPPDLAKEELT